MPDRHRRRIGIHLAWLLSVAIAWVFATTLILVTGDLASLWPLYIVPIVIASLAYHVSGAVLSVALTAAIVALLAYSGAYRTPPLLALLAGLVAYAISGIVIGVQARRHHVQSEMLELDSTRDAVTGVWRADRIEQRLAEEVRRSGRYHASCACVLIDVPGFAEFRRTFGRIKTDLLLERLADLLRLTLRDTDSVGRHGTTGFTIILPSTDEEYASLVAARIAEAVTATEFEGDALEPTTHVPVAVAFATYPRDAASAAELLSVAEARLGMIRTTVSEKAADGELLGTTQAVRATGTTP